MLTAPPSCSAFLQQPPHSSPERVLLWVTTLPKHFSHSEEVFLPGGFWTCSIDEIPLHKITQTLPDKGLIQTALRSQADTQEHPTASTTSWETQRVLPAPFNAHLQGLRPTAGRSARFPRSTRKTNHTDALRSLPFTRSEEYKPNRLTAHGHHRSPAQNCARAAAGHALIAASRRRAQGGDAQRPVLDLHPWQPAAQRLSIQQPGDASCRGLSGAAQHHGATGLLDGRDGLGSKAGSQV